MTSVVFEKIEFQNIGSFGNNQTHTLEFKKGTTKISGISGSGKSNLAVNVIHFALFGKAFDVIKKNTIPNASYPGRSLARVYFKKNDDLYMVERGIKPDKLNIFKNNFNEPLVSNTNKIDQKYLESEILGFNSNLFKQTTLLSSLNFQSFFELGKQGKIEFINNVFDHLPVLSQMKDINNRELKAINQEKITLESQIEKFEALITQEKTNIHQIEQHNIKAQQETQNEIDEHETTIKTHQEKLEKITNLLKQADDATKYVKKELQKINDLNNKINDLRYEESQFKAKNLTINTHLKFMREQCPACLEIDRISSEHNRKLIENFGNKDYQKEIETCQCEIKTIKDKVEKINKNLEKVSDLHYEKAQHKSSIEISFKTINKLKSREILKIDQTNLKRHQKTLKDIENEKYPNIIKDLKEKEFIQTILQENHLRSALIQQFLPLLNRLFNKFLKHFDIDDRIEFDEQFNFIVKSKNKKHLTYKCFSQGERRRISIALIMTFFEFLRNRNSTAITNLLIVDELGDHLGIIEDTLFSLLNNLAHKQNLSILIITHKDIINHELFDHAIEVYKDTQGFSQYNMVQI